jgi:hypothetical protein
MHLQPVVTQCIGVKFAHGVIGLGLCAHRDETKAFGFSAVPILNDLNGSHIAGIGEQSSQFILSGRSSQGCFLREGQ